MLVSAAFVASFFDIKNKNYNSFKAAWEEIKKITDIDPVVKANIISFAYMQFTERVYRYYFQLDSFFLIHSFSSRTYPLN